MRKAIYSAMRWQCARVKRMVRKLIRDFKYVLGLDDGQSLFLIFILVVALFFFILELVWQDQKIPQSSLYVVHFEALEYGLSFSMVEDWDPLAEDD